MRILQVYDLSGSNDGPGHQLARMRGALEERGHEVRLMASSIQRAPGPAADYVAFGTDHGRRQVLTQTLNPSAYRVLRRALAEFQPDVVHVRQFLWQLSPLILPLLRTVPTVYHLSHYKAVCPVATKLLPDGSLCGSPAGRACLGHGCVTPQTWAFMMLQLRLFRRWQGVFDQYVALSTAMKHRLEAEGIGPVEVVHNAVAMRPMRTRLAETPLVVYAGRLVRAKGVDVLLRAHAEVVRAVPAARLIVAGDGPERASLQDLASRLNLDDHVSFTGHLARERMEAEFETAWVQVVPSVWEEPFGNVVTEAMMRGNAVIASRIGGIQDIIQDDVNGILVPPGDASILSRALVQLLTNPSRAASLGEAGRTRVIRDFGEDRLVDRMEQIFRVVASQSRADGPMKT